MSKDFDYYYDRLEVYKDSIEVADGVESMHCKEHLYWPREGSLHIRGLWHLTLKLAAHGKRMQKRIKELEEQINGQTHLRNRRRPQQRTPPRGKD